MKRRRSVATARPTPVEGIRAKRAELADSFGKRSDRWSGLLSKAITDELRGQYIVSRSGLSAEEHQELAALTPDAHQKLRVELDQAIARLRTLLAAGDAFYILSFVQDLNVFVPWGEYYEPTHQGSEAKVELVAGLLATQPAVTGHERPPADAIQAILDEIDHVLEVMLLFNLSMPPRGDGEVAELRFMSTMRWMSVRGSSFAGHGEDLARAVYEPQGAWLLQHLGFTISDVMQVGRTVAALDAERRNEVGRAGADAANDELRGATGLTDAAGTDTFARAIFALLAVVEAGRRNSRTLTPELICRRDPTLDVDRVASILRQFSVPVGALDPSLYTGLYDENPLRTRPFLSIDGEYMLALPGALTRDVDQLLESRLLQGNPGFSKERAKVLDRLAVAYLATLLPGASSHTNLFYERNELDGLLIFEDIAFIVEGKGSGISVQGQRGDTTRLGRDITDAVEDAWRQGARAREYILSGGDAVFTDEDGADVIRLPAGRVRKVVIVNPTLHELAGFAPQLPRLGALGLFAAGDFPWSVYINDLRVIAETSENPAVFLHYLEWRGRLPLGDRVTVLDEIDLWASYLLCERFGALHDGGRFMVGNASTDFDAYYDGLAGKGPARDAPKKFLPDRLRTFVSHLADSRPPGWREATGVILDLSLPELAFVDTKLREVASASAGNDPVAVSAGRVLLVGIPIGANASQALFMFDAGDSCTLAIACRLGAAGEPEIAWAQYRKSVTFELSEFERQTMSLVTTGSTQAPLGRRARNQSR